MSRGEDYLEYEYLSDTDIVVGVIIQDAVEVGEIAVLNQYLNRILDEHTGFRNLVLDIRNLHDLSCPLMGILMMVLKRVSPNDGCLALVITEDYLKKNLFRFPEVFDHYTVFHTIEEAIDYIAR